MNQVFGRLLFDADVVCTPSLFWSVYQDVSFFPWSECNVPVGFSFSFFLFLYYQMDEQCMLINIGGVVCSVFSEHCWLSMITLTCREPVDL